jgi:hypothetical protein
MSAVDWLVVGLWLTAIAFMVIMAWEPWRETSRLHSIDLSDEFVGRAVTPRYVFILPAFVAIAPLVAQLVSRPGTVNLWRHPHLLSPAGPVALIVIVAIQAILCRSVLRAARRQREAHEHTRQTLLSAGRKSVRRPR